MGSFERNGKRYTITCEEENPVICFKTGDVSVTCSTLVACMYCETLFDTLCDFVDGSDTIKVEKVTMLPLKYNKKSMELFVHFLMHYDVNRENEGWNMEVDKVSAVQRLRPFFIELVKPADAARWSKHLKEHPDDNKKQNDGNWPKYKDPEGYPTYYLTDFINIAMFYNSNVAIEAACYHYGQEFIVNKETEEIRDALHIHNDMTEEDEKEIDAIFEKFKQDQQKQADPEVLEDIENADDMLD